MKAPLKAADIMTSDPFVITKNETVARAAAIMRDLDIGCVPVVDDPSTMTLLGLITDRDIAIRCVAEAHGTSCMVAEHMTPMPLDTVHPNDDLETIVHLMETEQVRRIPVVSEANTLQGMIAQADLATKVGHENAALVEALVQRVSMPHLRQVPA